MNGPAWIPKALIFLALPAVELASMALVAQSRAAQQTTEITAVSVPDTPEIERFPVKVTWYGLTYKGRTTASGERFDPEAMTAAHRTLPIGTRVRVPWLGREVTVRINDRTAPGVDVLDLSAAAFRELAPLKAGVLHVICEVVS